MDEIYLDTESQRGPEEVPGGWENIPAFGLAVAVTWDPAFGFRDWLEPDAALLLQELARFPRLITFNGNRFDLPLLSAYGPTVALRPRSFDVLADLKRRLGFRVSLGDLAQATLGRGKGGSGEEAIRWWRSGDPALRRKVVEYCRQDVALLRDCVEYGRQHGFVFIPGPAADGPAQRVYVAWAPA
ncbi:MAG: ribonuclease H-like domain-containing protein [candidate division NC10 bacterium]|nr:ribonuclease H-like domain-containing protein [candidate division NC10 bacterium]